MMSQNPPIGKAPNDGGGDLERAKTLVRLYDGRVGYIPQEGRDLLERLVKRVEEAENCKACGGKDVVCAKAWEQERNSLKSKLSEAEKAIEKALHVMDSTKASAMASHAIAYEEIEEALARLRADGGGRGKRS